MANPNSSTKATQGASTPLPRACHAPHSWLFHGAENNSDAQFTSMVMDISRGAEVIASILCNHLTDLEAIASGDDSTRTLLSGNHTEALARLMLVSLGHLHEVSSARIDEFNRKAESGALA